MRPEYWMVQACSMVAIFILFYVDSRTAQGETLVKLIRLLYDIGQYLPLANRMLSTLSSMVAREGFNVPSIYQRHLAAAVANKGM